MAGCRRGYEWCGTALPGRGGRLGPATVYVMYTVRSLNGKNAVWCDRPEGIGAGRAARCRCVTDI
jgi:hypothetical protein